MPATSGKDVFDAFDQPPKKAVEKLKKLGISTTGSFEDMMSSAEGRAFVLAKVTQADILQDFKNELERALEEGTNFQEFKNSIRETMERRGWVGSTNADGDESTLTSPWRLKVIYRNNIQSALQAGRYTGQLETINRRPYAEYIAVIDKRTSEVCNSLNGVIRRLDDPFWDTYHPQNHHLCRARLETLSEREMQRDGRTLTTDDEVDALEKPAKGFDRSPLAPYEPDTTKYSADIAKQLKSHLKK